MVKSKIFKDMEQKEYMVRFYGTLVFSLILLICLASCTSEESPYNPEGRGTTTLQYTLTKATADEERITGARLVVFNLAGHVLVNTTTPKYGWTFEELVPSGILHIYLIANEFPSWNLGAVTSPAELKEKVLSFTAYPVVDTSTDIPMFGAFENHPTTADVITEINDNTFPDGTVERLYSKVSLDLSCNFTDLGGKKIILDKIRIRSLPAESWLFPAGYAGTSFFDGADILPGTSHGYDVTDNTGFSNVELDFYIPEYLITDKSKYSYLSIVAYEALNPVSTREYKLAIGDSIAVRTIEEMKSASATLADLTVTRNRHYQFEAQIKGFDHELEVIARVVTWNGVEVPTTYPTYLLAVSRDNFSLASGETGYIYITTDHPGGWSATIGAGTGQAQFSGYVAGTPYQPSGYLGVHVAGTIIVPDTVIVTAGNMTKKIIVTN